MITTTEPLIPVPTTQEAYEHIRDYFSQPGAGFSMGPSPSGESCKYRSEQDGVIRKCAVGCLIPDDIYDAARMAEIEGMGLSSVATRLGWGLKGFPAGLEGFLRDAQSAHDARARHPNFTVEHFIERLDDMQIWANEYKALEPENGWGDYQGAVDTFSWLLDHCREHPKARISV